MSSGRSCGIVHMSEIPSIPVFSGRSLRMPVNTTEIARTPVSRAQFIDFGPRDAKRPRSNMNPIGQEQL